MFDSLNKLNLKLQGQQTHVLQIKHILSGLLSKVQNWHWKVTEGNIAMSTNLSQRLNPLEALSADLQVDMWKSPENEFKNYFPDLNCGEEAFVRNPFTPGLDITVIADDIEDELLELRPARDTFLEKCLAQFWCSLQELYPQVCKRALRLIVPFASTYLCES
ncbi:zinc finger BED domain-containing protein 5-like [Aplysia californica]|uniref:Zinc finger BED domain-containing protein 5-like n=1 Tax=Aplysia californica TaxID=6500 RepID=A0ABM0K9F7_APLCA|nr:zinc finger BED domain-containing protein 5-like [Aplysia californica]